jgi:biotin carboxylase
VKPVDGTASKGVSIMRAPAEAESAFVRASGVEGCSQVAVEEFLAGDQYSYDGPGRGELMTDFNI